MGLEQLKREIAKGPKVKCSRSGRYFPLSETNPDGKGGRIAKVHDYWIHDQNVEKSKYQEGPGWERGRHKLVMPANPGTSVNYDELADRFGGYFIESADEYVMAVAR